MSLTEFPKEEWVGKQGVFTEGRYVGENAWVLGHGSGLAHLIMGDDDDKRSNPQIISRIPSQLIVEPEDDNDAIEPFEPSDFMGKFGHVTDGYGEGLEGFVAGHGNGSQDHSQLSDDRAARSWQGRGQEAPGSL